MCLDSTGKSGALTLAVRSQGAFELHESATPATDRVSAYKHAVSALLDEYWASGDAGATTEALEELGHPLYAHYFVKRAVRPATRPAGSSAGR